MGESRHDRDYGESSVASRSDARGRAAVLRGEHMVLVEHDPRAVPRGLVSHEDCVLEWLAEQRLDGGRVGNRGKLSPYRGRGLGRFDPGLPFCECVPFRGNALERRVPHELAELDDRIRPAIAHQDSAP